MRATHGAIAAALLVVWTTAGLAGQVAASGGPAAMAGPGGLGLEEAIARARAAEPGLEAARAGVDVARGERRQSGLRPNPNATIEHRREPGGTDRLTSIGVAWPLDLFRRGGRVATADRQVTAAELSVADRDRILVADVRAQYGRAAAASREARIAGEIADTVARQVAVLRSRADEGVAPRLDADLLEVERRRLDGERDLAIGRAERALLALKPLLGLAPQDPLTLSEPLEALVMERGRPQPAAWDAAAVAARPDVREAATEVAIAEARIDQARRDARPDVSLFGSYMRMDAGFPQLGFSPSGGLERVRGRFHYVSGGATVTLPILDRREGQISMAQAERARADARRRAAELAAGAEMAAAAARVRQARQALAAYGEGTLALAQRNLGVVRQTFELGRATVFDVLAEQRRYQDLEQAYTMTLLEAWEADADLGRAAGDPK